MQLRTHGADPRQGFGKRRGSLEKRPPLSGQRLPAGTLMVATMGLPNQNHLLRRDVAARPPSCPQIPPCPAPGCGRTCWQDLGVLQRGLSPRVGRGPCSSAAPAGGPGCPCRCPARARPFAPPGTRINCSYFPSLTALLLAGTNCESPQGRTAHPARDVPPTPGLCYPEFRISCSRLGDQGSGGAAQAGAKRLWTWKGAGTLFRLEPQGCFPPRSLATS